MRRRAFVAVCAAVTSLAMSAPVRAETRRDGIVFNQEAGVAGHEFVLRGTGARTVTIFSITVFVGGLYAPRGDLDKNAILDAKTPKLFRAVFRRHVDSADAAKSFRKAILQSAGGSAPSLGEEIERFVAWLPSFDSGSELVVEYAPESGLSARVEDNKGKRLPLRASSMFATALFGAWVGPRAIDTGLRESLLKP